MGQCPASGYNARNAEVAQLVERNLAKVEVAGSSPVFRSNIDQSMLKVRQDHGDVAEWLGTGLQNLLPRFNSGRRLDSDQGRLAQWESATLTR